MKVAGIRELRANSATLFGSGEPVLVTKHGKVSGVYVPLDDPDHLPDDLRRELVTILGRHFTKVLDRKGVSEKEVLEDFRAHRKRRR